MKIHTILFCVLLATFYHLFYKPQQKASTPAIVHTDPSSSSDDGLSLLLRCASDGGFRCQDGDACDCEEACPKRHLEKKTTLATDGLLPPGTYCLPPPSSGDRLVDCDSRSSMLVYSASGWWCRSKPHWQGGRRTVCKSESAVDNASNVLVDVVRTRGFPTANAPTAPSDADVFETFRNEDGEEVPRYRCRCDSLDDRGNRMVSVTPYRCAPDYCLREFRKMSDGVFGWNGSRCECGPFPHADPADPESPCVPRLASEWKEGVIREIVPCMHAKSRKESSILCPPGHTSVSFQKRVFTSNDPLDFVRFHKDATPRILVVETAAATGEILKMEKKE